MTVRRATERDAEMVATIYNYYVVNTAFTFETEPVDATTVAERIREKLERHDFVVGEVAGRIVGYAYYGKFRGRAAYGHTVEPAIYVDHAEARRGYGKSIYAALMDSAASKGYREVVAYISLPNPSSIALHRSFGFEETGLVRRVGLKFDRYVDVGIYQLSLTPAQAG